VTYGKPKTQWGGKMLRKMGRIFEKGGSKGFGVGTGAGDGKTISLHKDGGK